MKRFVVLLILLAGGLAAAAFVIPTNAASVGGVSISQQQVNSDLHAIGNSADYQCFLNAEQALGTGQALPSVYGTVPIGEQGAHPTVTAAFAANYLNTVILHQVVFSVAAARHTSVTAVQLATARQNLKAQINQVLSQVSGSKFGCTAAGSPVTAKEVLASMPKSFIDTNVTFDATLTLLEEDLSGVGSSEADLQRYFANHPAEFDKDCFTVAAYSSESEAEAAESQVASGTSFGTVAAAAAAASGQSGSQLCTIFYDVSSSLPSGNLEDLPLNTVSSPVTNGSTYFLLEITSQTPVSYTTARSAVQSAVQNAGATKIGKAVAAVEKAPGFSVDPRYGQWEPANGELIPPVSPAPADVLHASVNGAGTATSASGTPATGQSS